ncbi:hypothetical protein Q2941_15425 [Bradyrhizobium sp. UFLA05-153]
MEQPLITTCIPTRERAETLAHTQRTLTSEDCSDCEFGGSGNANNQAPGDDDDFLVSNILLTFRQILRTQVERNI